MLAGFQGLQQVAGGFLCHPFKPGKIIHGQAIEITGIVYQPFLDQLLYQLVAETLDIHGAARGKMLDGLLALRGADQSAGTTRHGLPFNTHHV